MNSQLSMRMQRNCSAAEESGGLPNVAQLALVPMWKFSSSHRPKPPPPPPTARDDILLSWK